MLQDRSASRVKDVGETEKEREGERDGVFPAFSYSEWFFLLEILEGEKRRPEIEFLKATALNRYPFLARSLYSILCRTERMESFINFPPHNDIFSSEVGGRAPEMKWANVFDRRRFSEIVPSSSEQGFTHALLGIEKNTRRRPFFSLPLLKSRESSFSFHASRNFRFHSVRDGRENDNRAGG